jgi:uncharacterized protein (TIGR02421 family)
MAKSNTYLEAIKRLSDRIVEAQRPIRILDAIKWKPRVKEEFLEKKAGTLPSVDRKYYLEECPLGFDAALKRQEFYDIDRDISRQLGQMNPLTRILQRICREYLSVVRMLEARGTPEFGSISQELYGSSGDVFHVGEPTIAELGLQMERILANLLTHDTMRDPPKTIPSSEAVRILNERMASVFPDCGIRVIISDGIAADAAAGHDYIKLREDAFFSAEDLNVLEAHEGWIHVGTTLNGMAQPYCTFLSKGPPSGTITQEGLAVLTEIITLRSSPSRLYRLICRVRAVTLAEEGASFIEVFEYLKDRGLDDDSAYVIASRVFRGSTPEGLPFTKDITYIKGFVLTYNFVRLAVTRGRLDRLPLLFCGKTVLEDIPVLGDLEDQGVLAPPRFLPPHFAQLKGLASWLSFSKFIAGLDFGQLEADYAQLL